MSRNQDSNVALRKLQDQVAQLKKQLQICREQTEQLQAEYIQDIDAATAIGYELGFIEAEEKQLQREKAILVAVENFEKAYAKNKKSTALPQQAKRKVTTKKSAKPMAKKAGKRRGRLARPARKGNDRTSVPAVQEATESVVDMFESATETV